MRSGVGLSGMDLPTPPLSNSSGMGRGKIALAAVLLVGCGGGASAEERIESALKKERLAFVGKPDRVNCEKRSHGWRCAVAGRGRSMTCTPGEWAQYAPIEANGQVEFFDCRIPNGLVTVAVRY